MAIDIETISLQDYQNREAVPAETSRTHSDHSTVQDVVLGSTVSIENPPNEADIFTDSRPTRRYQILLLVCGFLMIFQVIGINSTYGIFQQYYTSPQSNIKDAQGKDALVSLVGTIGYGLTWGGGIVINPLLLKVSSPKILTLLGTVLMSLGLFTASFSTKLWHLFVTQALLYGVGATLLYFPIVSSAPKYFDRHRGFAMGVILSGNGIGGLVLAPSLHAMINRFGIQWTLRALGVFNLIFMAPVACVVRQPPGFEARRRMGVAKLDKNLILRGTFLTQALGSFLQASGNIVPLFYLTTYSTSVLSYTSSAASLLLALNNAINSVARIAMGSLADRVGRQNTLISSVLLSSLSVLALWYNATRAHFLAFVVLYGILAGGYNALLPTTIAEVYGVQNYYAVNGAIYFIRGMGAVVGPPIAGAILGSHQRGTIVGGAAGGGSDMSINAMRKKYSDLVVYDGVLLIGASLCVALVRWYDARERKVWQWRA